MRRVLVTGGGSGIGRAIARAFADAGDDVTITGRRMAPMEETSTGRMTCVQADVTNEAQMQAVFERPFDVVVANAGVAHWSKLPETTLEQWNMVQQITLTGVFLTFREALKGMEPGGRLIAIASTASLQGGIGLGAYAAAKHGVLGLVRSVAKEVARKGITCNAVCPGFVETEMAEEGVRNLMDRFGIDRDDAVGRITGPNPMRRMIQPEEVSSAVLYLASAGASSVNGHALSVSGGEV
ncbi:MAG: 3-hydroxyacyl-CoA dehydrogenase [Rhodobacterales bacterium]|nr:MAG: 3-hydroxyacyl-CoA dehydrogenase [Rhodobacterales bacterium]